MGRKLSTSTSGWRVARLPALLAIFSLSLQARALEVRIADVGRTSFIDDMQDTKYVIALRTHKEVERLGEDADAGSTPVVMSDKLGNKYKCFLPPVGTEEGAGGEEGEESSGTGSTSSKPPSVYLSGLTSTCFYRVEGWWTYELCYKKAIRQYHQDQDKISSEFILGKFDEVGSGELEIKVIEGDTAGAGYFSQRYSEGTPCDITGTPRETEVRFVCSADAASVISSIKEPSTCSYVVVFQTPLLCKHPTFRKKTVTATPIYCNPLSAPPEDVVDSLTADIGGDDEEGASDPEKSTTFESNGGTYKLTYVDGRAHVQIVQPGESGGDEGQNDGGWPLNRPPGGPAQEGGSGRVDDTPSAVPDAAVPSDAAFAVAASEDEYEEEKEKEEEEEEEAALSEESDDAVEAQPPSGRDEL